MFITLAKKEVGFDITKRTNFEAFFYSNVNEQHFSFTLQFASERHYSTINLKSGNMWRRSKVGENGVTLSKTGVLLLGHLLHSPAILPTELCILVISFQCNKGSVVPTWIKGAGSTCLTHACLHTRNSKFQWLWDKASWRNFKQCCSVEEIA